MLKLTVPSPDPTLSQVVETRPKPVAECLKRLPYASPTDAAQQLTTMLAAMNRTELDDEARYKCLSLIHPVIARLATSLEAQLAETGIPPGGKYRQTGALMRELWVELGYGYKLVLLSLSGRRGGLRAGKRFVDVTSGLLQALRDLQIAYYQTYASLPPGLWREIHHLHQFARKAGFADTPAGESGISPSLAYRQALLMALADPYHMQREALLLTRLYLKKFASLSDLAAERDAPEGKDFFIRVNADRAASPPPASDPPEGLWLHTERLCQHLHEVAIRLKIGDTPRALGLPQGMQGELGKTLVIRLLKSWGKGAQRNFNRREPAPSTLRLVAGVCAVHRLLAGERSPLPEPDEDTLTVNDLDSGLTPIAAPTPSTWTLLNDSAGGLALGGSPDAALNLKVGDALALQENGEINWSLGVIRWIRMIDSSRVELGVERLSPQMAPVWIRPLRGHRTASPEPALLVPGLPALKRQECLLLPRHVYQSSMDAEMWHPPRQDNITFGHRVEQTPSFDLVEFAVFH